MRISSPAFWLSLERQTQNRATNEIKTAGVAELRRPILNSVAGGSQAGHVQNGIHPGRPPDSGSTESVHPGRRVGQPVGIGPAEPRESEAARSAAKGRSATGCR